MVAVRHRLAAYHNKHCWRAFRGYQHRWPWTTLNLKNLETFFKNLGFSALGILELNTNHSLRFWIFMTVVAYAAKASVCRRYVVICIWMTTPTRRWCKPTMAGKKVRLHFGFFNHPVMIKDVIFSGKYANFTNFRTILKFLNHGAKWK